MTNIDKAFRDLQLVAKNHNMEAFLYVVIPGQIGVPLNADLKSLFVATKIDSANVEIDNNGAYIPLLFKDDAGDKEYSGGYEDYLRVTQCQFNFDGTEIKHAKENV